MTERTVEVEVTQTEETTVNICDYCGLETSPDADDSVTYLPVLSADVLATSQYHGEEKAADVQADLAAAGHVITSPDPEHETLHFHERCLAEATLTEGEVNPPRWADMEDVAGNRIRLAMGVPEIVWTALGLTVTIGSVVGLTGSAMIIGLLPGLAMLFFAIGLGVKQALDPDEHLREL